MPISSDFENKFVCGEIMSYTDLHEHGSEAAVKAAGKLKQQGKTYESASSRSPSVSALTRNLSQWSTATSHTGKLARSSACSAWGILDGRR